MGNLSSSFAESLTGKKQKEPVEPETAGVLSMDWQQLAAQAKRAAHDMREVANNVPEEMSDYDVAGAAKDVMAVAQRRREKPVGRRREQSVVNRNKTSQGSKTKKQNDAGMEF